MIVSQEMVAEAEVICQKTVLDVKYRVCVAKDHKLQIDVASSSPTSPSFGEVVVAETISPEISRFESVLSCTETINNAVMESSAVKFVPNIHSGSHSDIGSRDSMDDEHIRIDDLSAHMGPRFKCPFPSAFYAVFDGHGGPEAAAYIKRNAKRLFFEDADLPQRMDMDAAFFRELENSHRKAFLLADHALADERSVRSSCGTTALTALILGWHLMVANAGDCRAVLCRKGIAVDMSQDHRPSYLPERMRVEQLGGYIDDGYLNGSISVTRALGDWGLKLPSQSLSLSLPSQMFSSQYAVSLVLRGLRRHDDPQQCAKELAKEALRLNTLDNLTVVVVHLSTPEHVEFPRQCPRLRTCSLSEEARSRLRSLLEGN